MHPSEEAAVRAADSSVVHLLRQRALESGSRQSSVWAVALAFIAIAAAVLAARLHVRLAVVKSVGLDDVFMIIGTVSCHFSFRLSRERPRGLIIFTFGLSAASMAAAWYGVGLHDSDIPPGNTTQMLQAVYATRLLYVVAIMFVKLSLLVFYLRLDRRPCMRYAVYALVLAVLGFSAASFFILTFTCYPPSMFWDVTGTVKGSCISPDSQQAFYDANGVLNIFIDLGIYITPMPTLWNIQISLRQRLAVMALFGLGIVAVAAGCVRFFYVRLLANTSDMYFFLADSLSWCEIEIYVAIICGSASAFKVLLRTYLPGILGSSLRPQKYGKTGSSRSRSRGYHGLGGNNDDDGSGDGNGNGNGNSSGRDRAGRTTTTISASARRASVHASAGRDSDELIIQREADAGVGDSGGGSGGSSSAGSNNSNKNKNIMVRTEIRMETLRRDQVELYESSPPV
ncbi:hypothetical protein GGR56DRAFT_675211 [Xylariaceae sp. FL0804]|nr:hypothetical protein GGR56DRAFT_675211 [Xylariaceae sp. FL0804]